MTPIPYSAAFSWAPRAQFFLSVDSKTVRADKILTAEQLTPFGFSTDGVRIGINVSAGGCRALRGNDVKGKMSNLRNMLAAHRATISVRPTEGFKSADGGLFFGPLDPNGYDTPPTKATHAMLSKDGVKLMPLLDTLVANSFTAMGMRARPSRFEHKDGGFLYQTLSNIYLKAYPLMSFAAGMARFAIGAAAQSTPASDYASEILATVPQADIKRAIETGDKKLALKNWLKLEKVISDAMGDKFHTYPLGSLNSVNYAPAFRHFLSKPLDHWFKHDLMTHWATLPDGHYCGWETFLSTIVSQDMNADKVAGSA